MRHEEFTGVTFNDLNPSGTRISRSPEFSVVNNTGIALNIPHKAHIRYVRVFAVTNPSVVCLSVCLSSVWTFVHLAQGIEAFGNSSSPCVLWPSSDIRAKFYADRPKRTSVGGVERKKGIAK